MSRTEISPEREAVTQEESSEESEADEGRDEENEYQNLFWD